MSLEVDFRKILTYWKEKHCEGRVSNNKADRLLQFVHLFTTIEENLDASIVDKQARLNEAELIARRKEDLIIEVSYKSDFPTAKGWKKNIVETFDAALEAYNPLLKTGTLDEETLARAEKIASNLTKSPEPKAAPEVIIPQDQIIFSSGKEIDTSKFTDIPDKVELEDDEEFNKMFRPNNE